MQYKHDEGGEFASGFKIKSQFRIVLMQDWNHSIVWMYLRGKYKVNLEEGILIGISNCAIWRFEADSEDYGICAP